MIPRGKSKLIDLGNNPLQVADCRARTAFGEDTTAFEAELRERARRLARDPESRLMLRKKHERRLDDEYVKPLANYRAKELERMHVNFFGPDPSYHEARRRFVFKGNPPPQRSRAPIQTAVEAINNSLEEMS